MSAPAVVATVAYVGPASDATSWQPFSSVSVNKGSVIIVSADGDPTNPTLTTASSNWTKLGQNDDSGGAYHSSSAVFYKTADGTGEFTVSSSNSQQFTAILLRVDTAKAVSGTVASDTNNPPSHTTGSRPMLWVAGLTCAGGANASSAPAGYSGFITATAGSNGASTALAYRTVTSGSENPGTFSGVSAEAGSAWTIAIGGRRRRAGAGAFI